MLLVFLAVAGGVAEPRAKEGPTVAEAGDFQYPDLGAFPPDLVVPVLAEGLPAAGRRVRAWLPAFAGTEVYHSLYLPTDWQSGKNYPVVFEYSGNGDYRSKHGDVSTGRVEDSCLGYGISGPAGAIWVVLPFVDRAEGRNATRWWGDRGATIEYCKEAVRQVCTQFGGDATRLTLCGFSRGALACNVIGLGDDAIAGLWRAFFPASHYLGARSWPVEGTDAESARGALDRLGTRPVFVAHEVYDTREGTYSLVDTVNYLAGTGRSLAGFTFQVVPIRNHTDRWVLCDLAARRNLRAWWRRAMGMEMAPGPTSPSGSRSGTVSTRQE